ncbi:ATP-binding SpoIIE family protein phosphatase [Streptacidiphilus sp. P02-A3a]|uniref:ATP-binding SpoIIE family protein phosphatase n=1 Tax=Streptacidiphilus sp. P02-A3a TaxID=2704468 RepID=UPI0015FAA092|nr:ATP-binding SpoIIE family protein phosphatase [Streptacidiphilus sp. P02-A3a]QMU70534.1 SpoIIE family protein phosphatase [Streptacidiphilus sp. P02-A3a]
MVQVNLSLLEGAEVTWFRELSAARGAAAALARRMGLDEQRAGQVALAVSEAATNLDKHAVDGTLLLRAVRDAEQAGVEFLAVDSGPGMSDVPDAMLDGSSSTGTLGIGLGAVARLADVFDIHSIPGRGTVLAARFWPRNHAERAAGGHTRPEEPVADGVTRPISGEQQCGDAWAAKVDHGPTAAEAAPERQVRTVPGGGAVDWASLTATRPVSTAWPAPRPGEGSAVLVMLCDGLGHGPLAALAAEAAVRAFRDSRSSMPEQVVQDIHRALRGTRGAALAVARIEPQAGRLLFCGIGNIAATLLGHDSRVGLMSHPGIVGHQMRSMRTFEQPLPPGSALVMHTDGLTERWSRDTLPGLLLHSPVVMAAQLLREAGIRHDDAGVVVAKGAW